MGTLGGVLLCSSVHQVFDGPASLLFSCQCWHLGEKIYADGSTPTHDSAVSPCFHGCPTFLHRHFPAQSSASYRLDPSLCSQQQPSLWYCSTIPKLHLPAAAPSRGPVSLSGVCMAAARTVWFSFHIGCHSCLTLGLKCFFSDLDNCTKVGLRLLLQSPHLLRAGPVLLTLLFFPLVPSSYWVLHGFKYSFPVVR